MSLWPLNKIVHDTQYLRARRSDRLQPGQTGPIDPAIEGRVQFGTWLKTFMPIVGKN